MPILLILFVSFAKHQWTDMLSELEIMVITTSFKTDETNQQISNLLV